MSGQSALLETGDPALREKFLQGMSRAACTVNIVTTDGPAGRSGVTVSAMASVSADGEAPTLLVCVHHLSPAAACIIANGCFAVNILREDQSHISDTFAGRLPTADGDKFSCTGWRAMASGAPRVSDPLVAFDCQLQSAERVGTHHIFIGRVRDAHVAPGGKPLIFANRAYGSAERMTPLRASAPNSEAAAPPALRIGVLRAFGPSLLPPILKAFEREEGRVPLELVEGDQRELLGLMRSGGVDLAFLYDFDLGEDLSAEILKSVPPYVLLAEDHPLVTRAEIRIADLAPHPMIQLTTPPSRDYFLSLFEREGLAPRIAYCTQSLEMARGLVGNGLGYCLMGTRPAGDMTHDGKTLVARPLAGDLPVSALVMTSLRDRPVTGLAERFAFHCRSVFGTDL